MKYTLLIMPSNRYHHDATWLEYEYTAQSRQEARLKAIWRFKSLNIRVSAIFLISPKGAV